MIFKKTLIKEHGYKCILFFLQLQAFSITDPDPICKENILSTCVGIRGSRYIFHNWLKSKCIPKS